MPEDINSSSDIVYTPSQVVNITGISASTLRNYSRTYKGYLSPSAAPDIEGATRFFTEGDVQMVLFIRSKTDKKGEGLSHDAVKAMLKTGDWTGTEFEPPAPTQPAQSKAEVVTSGDAAKLWSLIDEYHKGEEEQRLEVNALQRELGTAQGHLTALQKENEYLKQQLARPWWKRLLGIE